LSELADYPGGIFISEEFKHTQELAESLLPQEQDSAHMSEELKVQTKSDYCVELEF